MSRLRVASDLLEAVRRIGAEVAGPAAEAVDREARFPFEAIAALREERMLGALVPRELGGRGATITEVGAVCEMLGRFCASTAMIYAMHQIEVACSVRHGLPVPFFRRYLAELAEREWLIASATSETGVGGDLRRSVCAVERDEARIRIRKQAPVISYGEEADDILLTARRDLDAAAGDQVLVLLRKADTRLTRTGEWDTLGMRGTRSLGFALEAVGAVEQILPVPFADIASQTMLPTSHVLWTSLWLGLASDAVGRARAFVRAEARRAPGAMPPGALRLAETVTDLGTMRATVHGGLADFERNQDDPEALAGLGFAIRMNNLKVAAARMAPEIVARALAVCGVSGYRCDSPYAVGRHLRDAHSAALMISNDRVLSANAAMLLLYKKTEVATTEGTVRTAQREFRDELLRHGLLISNGVPGVYGCGVELEDTVERVDRLVAACGADDRPEVMRFPPIINRAHFERSGYLKSFPHLAGSIHSFAGDEPAHRELLEAVEAGRDWSAALPHAAVVLTPAACYPVYPILAGTLPAGGRLVDVMSYCFRHEPSEDAGRMQMFRMHEHIRATGPESAMAWREVWVGRAERLTAALGLSARLEVASDQFFGRGGKLLAVSQRDQRLKLEIATPIGSDERPTAIISLNYHQDYFGHLFGIGTADGAVAHTACVGFGLERIALALYRRHGFGRARWSPSVREALGL